MQLTIIFECGRCLSLVLPDNRKLFKITLRFFSTVNARKLAYLFLFKLFLNLWKVTLNPADRPT